MRPFLLGLIIVSLCGGAPLRPADAAQGKSSSDGGVPPGSITCGSDGCSNLLGGDIQFEGKVGGLGGRELTELSPTEICINYLSKALWLRDASPAQVCGDLKISTGRDYANNGTVVPVSYGKAEPQDDSATIDFRPTTLFVKPRPFLPCFSPFRFAFDPSYSYLETIPNITTIELAYFKGRKDLEALFGTCAYQLQHYAAPPYHHEYPLPQWTTPFGANLIDAYHVATLLVPLTDVADGPAIFTEISRLADAAAVRTKLCRELEAEICATPRRIIIGAAKDRPYDQVIAQCDHLVLNGELEFPQNCRPVAVRRYPGAEWLMFAIISPESFFPSGNGIGDTDIVCEARPGQSPMDVLRRKFAASAGYRITGTDRIKLIRKGARSEVYPNWRENLVVGISVDGRQAALTPNISFNPQNTPNQEDYKPITVQQYNHYVTRIVRRLAPEMACRDAR